MTPESIIRKPIFLTEKSNTLRGQNQVVFEVLRDANKVQIIFDQDNRYEAEIVGTDEKTDLALLKIKAQGKTKYVDLTHYVDAKHEELADIMAAEKPDFIQINYSVSTTNADRRLLPLAKDLGVAVMINRAFDDGRLFARVADRPLPGWAAEAGVTSWAQMFLRFVGWDAFVLSGHVLLCLRDAGVPLSESGTSKKDLRAAQAQLNAWRAESGLPMAWVSRICALSIGENYDVARLKEIMQL